MEPENDFEDAPEASEGTEDGTPTIDGYWALVDRVSAIEQALKLFGVKVEVTQ